MHSGPIENEVSAMARMGDDSPPVNLPKYRINIYFSFCFPTFSKAQLSVNAYNDGPARDQSLNSHSYAKTISEKL